MCLLSDNKAASQGAALKFKSLICALLLLHLLAHPVLHGLAAPDRTAQQFNQLPGEQDHSSSRDSRIPCLGCRTGQELVTAPLTDGHVTLCEMGEAAHLSPLDPCMPPSRATSPVRAPPQA